MNSRCLPAVLVACSVGIAAQTGPPVVFAPPVEVPVDVAHSPKHLGVGDVDGNGVPDLGMDWDFLGCSEGCSYGEGTHFQLGLGDGTFPASVGVPYQFELFVVADLDQDGAADLAGSTPYSTALVVHRGAFGSWPGDIENYGTAVPQSLVVQDLDVDGDLDIAHTRGASEQASYADPNTVDIRWNAGDGLFPTGLAYLVGASGAVKALDIAAGDLDANGLPDLCTIRQAKLGSDSWAHIVVGLGKGQIDGVGQFFAGPGARAPVIADVDGDERADVSVCLATLSVVRVLRGAGDGTLLPFADVPAGTGTSWLRVADFDGDDATDMLCSGADQSLHFLQGAGGGLFHPQILLPGDAAAFGQAAADVDLDGGLDAIELGAAQSTYVARIHRNQTAPWQNLGFAKPGEQGTPYLAVQGPPTDQGSISLRVLNAGPGAVAGLFVGSTAAPQPFLGGVLVPVPQLLAFPLFADAAGELQLAGEWPPGTPQGLTVVTQAWILQTGFVAATNAVAVNLP